MAALRTTVRVLSESDASAFRALRLQALRLDPQAFGAAFEEEEALPLTEFARRIALIERSFVLGAFDDPGALLGVIGWFRERGVKSEHKSVVWGAYVRPLDRGRGLGAARAA